MSFALNFTQDINDISTMKQKPLRKAPGGTIPSNQPGGAIPSNQIISEAPPKSLGGSQDLLYRQFEGEPEVFTKENPVYKYDQNQMDQTIEPPKPMMDPQMQMILQAQNDQTGPMALLAKSQSRSPLQELIDILGKTEYNL
jgi:hypothetical protein